MSKFVTSPLFWIVAVMLVGGALGGGVNYLLAKPDDVPPPRLKRSLLVGIAASLLVPLFLNMISSNLIELIRGGDYFKALVLLGFCLVAAISSTAFITTISDRVLSEAKKATRTAQEAKEEIEEVQNAIEPIVAKETESEPARNEEGFSRRAQSQSLETGEGILLKTLADGKWTLRSQSGLARDSRIDKTEVAELLTSLSGSGLVGSRDTGEQGIRWFITQKGRAAIED